MVVEVFIAERDREHPLPDQRRNFVLNQILPAIIAKALRPHPTSQAQHQMQLPQRGLPRFQNRTVPRYTLSASGCSSNHREVVLAKQLSLIRRPDAPNSVRNAG
jgi:hypothetical protein